MPALTEAPFTTRDQTAIRGMFDTTVRLINAGDWPAWAAQYADDGLLQPPNSPAVRGRANLLGWATAYPPVEEISAEASPVRVRWTGPFDLSGQPAISIPCGFSADGLPIALQIAGRRFDETTVFQAAAAFEQMSPSRGQNPIP